MTKHAASHFDHALTEAQISFAMAHFADRSAFFAETLELPAELGEVPCALYGPLLGDPPIGESEVTYATRGSRAWRSRMVSYPVRFVRTIVVIGGPHEEDCDPAHHWPKQCILCDGTSKIKHACIVYTMFGGPLALQEPDDPGCKDPEASRVFWRDHALAHLVAS